MRRFLPGIGVVAAFPPTESWLPFIVLILVGEVVRHASKNSGISTDILLQMRCFVYPPFSFCSRPPM
jgi:hypothetical protein